MKRCEFNEFEKLSGQLISVYEEISLLSKKNPNDAVNKFKLKLINRLLDQSNVFLSEKRKPFPEFSLFDEDDVPQNSDVVFIISQYIEAFEKIRTDNIVIYHGFWHWRIEGEKGESKEPDGMVYIRTSKPKGLKE